MELIDKVLEQIKKDVAIGDMTAIKELLSEVSEKNLFSFLPDYLTLMLVEYEKEKNK
jgi:hypothetical protein